jgi:hypothetical protein
MHNLKYKNVLLECTEVTQQKYKLYDDIEVLSHTYNINIKDLNKLCEDINKRTQYSFYESICVVSDELATGLNINQIIIKYGLDEELI